MSASRQLPKGRIAVALALLIALILLVILTLRILTVTEAQRSASQFARTEFKTTIANFTIEGSTDGTFRDTDLSLAFIPTEKNLRGGRENAVYEEVQIRMTRGSSHGGTAKVSIGVPVGAEATDFGGELRANIYSGASRCSSTDLLDGRLISKNPADEGTTLIGAESDPFTIAAPVDGTTPGVPSSLCLEVWMPEERHWADQPDPVRSQRLEWQVTAQLDL